MQLKLRMLSSTVIPVTVALGMAGAAVGGSMVIGTAQANPCAAKRATNPCAAKKSCAAKNPCRARAVSNPCAAKNPCNPCAAANPSNPCAGGGAAYSARCVIPRLKTAALCNPCAAKNPCNPGAAKRACNPCAAKNPCNPCAAANPCNPCNPCAAAAEIELTAAEARAAYDCIITEMTAAYAKSGIAVANSYAGWKRYSKVAYQSATHGGRFVQNYANATGKAYGRFEASGKMPAGTYLVKDSFTVTPDGKIGVGPLFIMRKMPAGWNQASFDWKYAMVMPNGAFFGETRGRNDASLKFCIDCHAAVAEDQDSMMFLPEDLRRN